MVTVTVSFPGGTLAKMNSPVESVSWDRAQPVALSSRTTFAPDTTAPLTSETTPDTVAAAGVWPDTGWTNSARLISTAALRMSENTFSALMFVLRLILTSNKTGPVEHTRGGSHPVGYVFRKRIRVV